MSKQTVEYIDHMGDDLAVVNAARVSFDKESEWIGTDVYGVDEQGDYEQEVLTLSEPDTRLIKYLAKYNHWTPFAHTSIKLRMGAPVPIRTQAFKSKQGFVENEESRRYIDSRPDVFIPDEWRMAADNVKQGSGGVHPDSGYFGNRYSILTSMCVAEYQVMIEDGICPEQARFILPQGAIVNWIWTGNLASYARFYNQRTDPHAQKETRDLAHMVGDIIKPLFPVSWAALTEGE